MTNEELINLAVLTEEIKQDLELVNHIISRYTSSSNNEKLNDRNFVLEDVLLKYGITPNLSGFNYIIEAVKKIKENRFIGITKELYPYIAEKYNTKSTRVERAIRHCIEVAAYKNLMDFDLRNKPTNSEFLSTLAVKY